MTNEITNEQIQKAVMGDVESLEKIIEFARQPVFNLSLRMLGFVHDAEDATQEILIKATTRLSTFRGDSKFSTWIYRIAVNYLIDYKKSPFYEHPLSFEYYGNDIRNAAVDNVSEQIESDEKARLSDELKLSCTNVMLQCLDAESRSIFILGSMFRIDSRVASEIFGISPEAFRQRLSRIRKNVAEFLAANCGLAGGVCSCSKRVNYALSQGRIARGRYEYTTLEPLDSDLAKEYTEEIEKLDELSLTFDSLPKYKSPLITANILKTVLNSPSYQKIIDFEKENKYE